MFLDLFLTSPFLFIILLLFAGLHTVTALVVPIHQPQTQTQTQIQQKRTHKYRPITRVFDKINQIPTAANTSTAATSTPTSASTPSPTKTTTPTSTTTPILSPHPIKPLLPTILHHPFQVRVSPITTRSMMTESSHIHATPTHPTHHSDGAIPIPINIHSPVHVSRCLSTPSTFIDRDIPPSLRARPLSRDHPIFQTILPTLLSSCSNPIQQQLLLQSEPLNIAPRILELHYTHVDEPDGSDPMFVQSFTDSMELEEKDVRRQGVPETTSTHQDGLSPEEEEPNGVEVDAFTPASEFERLDVAQPMYRSPARSPAVYPLTTCRSSSREHLNSLYTHNSNMDCDEAL